MESRGSIPERPAMGKHGLKRVLSILGLYTFFCTSRERKDVLQQYQAGKVFINYVGDYFNYLTLASYFFLVVSVFFTLLFAYQEFKNRHQISAAKIIYVISILLLYCIFSYSLIVGYIYLPFPMPLNISLL